MNYICIIDTTWDVAPVWIVTLGSWDRPAEPGERDARAHDVGGLPLVHWLLGFTTVDN